MYTNLRAVCTAAIHEKFGKLGGYKKTIEVNNYFKDYLINNSLTVKDKYLSIYLKTRILIQIVLHKMYFIF